MFSFRKAFAAVLAVGSLASATITISTPTFKTNSDNTITWTSSDPDTDPTTFSIELINPSFHSQFALANNVPATQGSITFQLPTIITNGDGYTVEFVDPGNINNVFASSGTFSIQNNDVGTSAANTLSTSSGSGTATSALSTASSTSASVSTISKLSQSSASSATSSASLSPTATSPSITQSSATSSGSSSSSSSAATNFPNNNNSASGLAPTGSVAVLVAGVLAFLF